MLAVLALILAVLAWFEHALKVNAPAFVDSYALAVLALAAIAAHLMWPTWRRPVP